MAEDRIGRASLFLASGTLVSRVLGFVKAIVLASAIGAVGSVSADAFAVANGLPNTVYVIVAGGVLSAVLVPQIVRAAAHADGGSAYINKLLTLSLVVIGGATVVATLLAPVLVWIYAASKPEVVPLAIAFAWWCLPQIFFYGLYTLLGEVLNARRSFGPFTWVPVLNNIVALAGLAVFGLVYGFDPGGDRAVGDWTAGMVALLAGTATLGIASQALVLFWFWRRIGLRFRPDFAWRGVGLGAAGRLAGWTFGMLLLTTLAGIVQTQVLLIASGAGASVAAVDIAWLVFMLPHSIIAVSIATAYFTRMSEHAHRDDLATVRDDVSGAIRGISLLLVFAAAVLIVVAYPFGAVFQSDTFAATAGLGNVIVAFAIGLPAFSALFVVQRTFYALNDTRTPFFFTLFQVVVFAALAFTCLLLPLEWIGVGIALSTTLAGAAQLVVATVLLRRRLGGIDGRRIAIALGRSLAALVLPVAAGVLLLVTLGGTTEGGYAVSGILGAVSSMAIIGVVMAALYFAGLWLLRSPELRGFAEPLVARLRRR
ncbi:murein biosynthesis integral membrane protein MurJ [Agromyces sp. CFH 90414]|uniref:Murein biosynthesis integral membrane protein MurJ n=1 Tax=Agromyces agglutinans TaxID=2662258 RepID=A0A6I2FAJ0_9MICO|nr:murein biosynthesis integral membrane protein MurJ [Agromyces agglutinans]MRG58973.1 murein biosynthesis integral membrane protein MurJ [Agromyces agglutinans]